MYQSLESIAKQLWPTSETMQRKWIASVQRANTIKRKKVEKVPKNTEPF